MTSHRCNVWEHNADSGGMISVLKLYHSRPPTLGNGRERSYRLSCQGSLIVVLSIAYRYLGRP